MKLIDKDKIVAEIEKAIDGPAPLHDQQCSWEDGYYCGLYKAESIIDNLEVKEVDLEKLLSDLDRYIKEFVATEEFERESIIAGHYWVIAKHAFLLGLKTQKGK